MTDITPAIRLDLSIHYAVPLRPGLPAPATVRRWAEAALSGRRTEADITLRIVRREESARLNWTYRRKHGPTNVLSFPLDTPAGLAPRQPLLGDLVICAPLVLEEAREQGKAPQAHWAHLVVHGVLHLLGYDHEQPHEAQTMESLETRILTRLGYPDPYAEDVNS